MIRRNFTFVRKSVHEKWYMPRNTIVIVCLLVYLFIAAKVAMSVSTVGKYGKYLIAKSTFEFRIFIPRLSFC